MVLKDIKQDIFSEPSIFCHQQVAIPIVGVCSVLHGAATQSSSNLQENLDTWTFAQLMRMASTQINTKGKQYHHRP